MSNINNRKIRFGVIAESESNINNNNTDDNYVLYIDNNDLLSVKKDNYSRPWNIKESIIDSLIL